MKVLLTKKMRLITLLVFIILTVIGAGLSPLVKINYDMREYLPEESNTNQAMIKMEEEFGKTSLVQIMTTNLSIQGAQALVEEISLVNHVKSVIWLGTVADITIPVENMDEALIEGFYHEGNLLFLLEFDEDDYSLNIAKAVDNIKKIVSNNNIKAHYRGAVLQNQSTRDKVAGEMVWIFLAVIPLAIGILFLASLSWFEPVLVLIVIGMAIVLNLGTNFLLSSVSYMTMAIASVLQLAMSLDYSLFMIHRYNEERENGLEPTKAAIKSTKDALGTVTASALTTIFGFLALLLMQYKIGFDIGVSLAKSIVISYLVTLVLLPVLLVMFDTKLMKYKHKSFNWGFKNMTSFFSKAKFPLFFVLLAIGGISLYIQSKAIYVYGDTVLKDPKDILVIDEQKITKNFGPFQPVIILYNNSDKAEAIELANLLYDIEEIKQIQSLVTSIDPTIPEDILPKEALSQFKGKNYSRMIIYTNILSENERMYSISKEITSLVHENLSHQAYILGVPVAVTEIKDTVQLDGVIVQIVSALVIALIIGIILKSIAIPIILVGLIEISIWMNIAITSLSGGAIVYIGYLVVTSLQLGATIDYAVLLSGRYNELRASNGPKIAIQEALSKSVPAILTSSLVLAVAGFAVALISKLGIVKEIGALIGRGAILSSVLVIFILPVLLLIFDKYIHKDHEFL